MTTVRTGQTVQVSGIYYCETHTHEITLVEGHEAPPCNHVRPGHATTWILRRETRH